MIYLSIISNIIILFFQREDVEPYVMLYSLIALEKFAQTSKRNIKQLNVSIFHFNQYAINALIFITNQQVKIK